MAKTTTIFMCSSCGNEFTKWAGQCPSCRQWNSLTDVTPLAKHPLTHSKSTFQKISAISPQKALSYRKNQSWPIKINEIDRVLGKGITYGGVYLIAGEPGIGKSTLLTQLAIKLAQTKSNSQKSKKSSSKRVLYVCSEENPTQVATRIKRLTNKTIDQLDLLNTSSVEQIISHLSQKRHQLAIIDSIQTVQTDLNTTTPGSPSQIRDSANLLIRLAKEVQVPLILVGHVTKTGRLAGPKLLEHMVDTVLELSGDRQHDLRLLRSTKNRFGPTDETGIFQMTEKGLEEVPDPSSVLLKGRLTNTPGSVLTLIMEGTRPLTIEVQALVVHSSLAIPRRIAKGINTSHLQLLCAILTKHTSTSLGTKDVFVNITGGLTVKEPGIDLGIALAILSSIKNKPLPAKSIVFGELGLLGEIRSVNFQDRRLKEAKSLGYKQIYSPTSHSQLKKIKF